MSYLFLLTFYLETIPNKHLNKCLESGKDSQLPFAHIHQLLYFYLCLVWYITLCLYRYHYGLLESSDRKWKISCPVTPGYRDVNVLRTRMAAYGSQNQECLT